MRRCLLQMFILYVYLFTVRCLGVALLVNISELLDIAVCRKAGGPYVQVMVRAT